MFKAYWRKLTAGLLAMGIVIVAAGAIARLPRDATAAVQDKRQFSSQPKEKATLGSQSRPIMSTAMSSDGKTLAFGTRDGMVTLLDVLTAKETLTFKAHREPVLSIAFSADGRTMATGTNGKLKENTVSVWDVKTGKPRTIQDARTGRQRDVISPHMAEIYCLAFSPDGGTLAVGGLNQTVGIFDLRKGEHRAWLEGHAGVIRSLAFAADGRTLISRSEDGTVKVWDVPPEGRHQRQSQGQRD